MSEQERPWLAESVPDEYEHDEPIVYTVSCVEPLVDLPTFWFRGDEYEANKLADYLNALQQQVREAAFAPKGDNHHNAAACPYCSPKLAKAEGVKALAKDAMKVLHDHREFLFNGTARRNLSLDRLNDDAEHLEARYDALTSDHPLDNPQSL